MTNNVGTKITRGIDTGWGYAYVHHGRLLGVLTEERYLRPWMCLTTQQQEEILLEVMTEIYAD